MYLEYTKHHFSAEEVRTSKISWMLCRDGAAEMFSLQGGHQLTDVNFTQFISAE